MLGKASNPMLEQAEQGIQSKVPANMQGALAKVIQAGLTIMYSPQLAQARDQHMAQASNPAQDAGQGAARLISNLYQQSNKSMPAQVIVPAAMIFAFEYLDLLAKSGKAQISPDIIAQTMQAVAASVSALIKAPDGTTAQAVIAQKQRQSQQAAPAAPSAAPAGIIASAQQGT